MLVCVLATTYGIVRLGSPRAKLVVESDGVMTEILLMAVSSIGCEANRVRRQSGAAKRRTPSRRKADRFGDCEDRAEQHRLGPPARRCRAGEAAHGSSEIGLGQKQTSWTPLFNGRDLTGWKTHPTNRGTGEWKTATRGSGSAFLFVLRIRSIHRSRSPASRRGSTKGVTAVWSSELPTKNRGRSDCRDTRPRCRRGVHSSLAGTRVRSAERFPERVGEC